MYTMAAGACTTTTSMIDMVTIVSMISTTSTPQLRVVQVDILGIIPTLAPTKVIIGTIY
jgi:hypothetical protein